MSFYRYLCILHVFFYLNIIFKESDLFILNNVCKYFRLARTFTRISSKPRNGHILVCTFERTVKNQRPTTSDRQ